MMNSGKATHQNRHLTDGQNSSKLKFDKNAGMIFTLHCLNAKENQIKIQHLYISNSHYCP